MRKNRASPRLARNRPSALLTAGLGEACALAADCPLEAVVRGVAPNSNPAAFAGAVIQKRQAGKIDPKDVQEFVVQAGLSVEDAAILTDDLILCVR